MNIKKIMGLIFVGVLLANMNVRQGFATHSSSLVKTFWRYSPDYAWQIEFTVTNYGPDEIDHFQTGKSRDASIISFTPAGGWTGYSPPGSDFVSFYTWAANVEISANQTLTVGRISTWDNPDDFGQPFYGWHTLDVNGGVHMVPPEQTQTVGGIVFSIDKLGLLAPYIGLTSTIIVATVATAIYVKRRKEKR